MNKKSILNEIILIRPIPLSILIGGGGPSK
nr:MAG TPA: hypothetical protein [Caudoviricetes sp.]